MNRLAHACATCSVVFAGTLALLALPATTVAAPSCGPRVLADWSDNGRIDRLYALGCYEDAIDALPPDLRDYTNAAEVIERALTTALRTSPASGDDFGSTEAAPALDPAASSTPVPLVAAAGVALAMLAGGVVAYLSRRHRG